MVFTQDQTTGKERVLRILEENVGEWVESASLYNETKCMVHSRIADLRRDGHRIIHRMIGGIHYYRLAFQDER